MIKFLHAADLHLGSAFAGLPPEAAQAMRAAQQQVLEKIVDLSNTSACDILLLSGDVFDSHAPGRDTVDAAIGALRGCRAAVFLAPGNHDYFSPDSPYATADWPARVHIFKKACIESVYLPQLDCEVYGAAFCAPSACALLQDFRAPARAKYRLMALHGELAADSAYHSVSAQQIAASGLTYLALGHIHKLQLPQMAGQTMYAWPGCPMGRGFDETGEKGVLLGELSDDGCAVRFVPIPAIRYEVLTLDCTGHAPAAPELPAHAAGNHCRLILTGTTDAPIDCAALHAALCSRFASLSIQDCTTRPVNLWADAGADTLKGIFLAKLRHGFSTAVDDAAIWEEAAKIGLAVLEEREVPLL